MERNILNLKQLYFSLAFLFLLSNNAQMVYSCSMAKITMHGKTMVGNNEDYWDLDTRIWFEPGSNENFGAVYIGLNNLYPQGGINEAGLAFDYFATEYKEVKNFSGKKDLPPEIEKLILQTCSTVEDVKSVLSQYNLRTYSEVIALYVDKTGKYLIVEGDSLIIGDDPYYLQASFYPSCTPNLDDVAIPFYQKGRQLLSNRKDTSLDFCTMLMDTMHQDWNFGGTLYTTIYDLTDGIIYLYFNYDYSTYVKFNIADELKKGKRTLSIPELFPENIEGHRLLREYNAIANSINLLNDAFLSYDTARFAQLRNELYAKDLDHRFESLIYTIGCSWLYDRQNIAYGIKVFKLNAEKFPASKNARSNYKEALILLNDPGSMNYNYAYSADIYTEVENKDSHSTNLNDKLEPEQTRVLSQFVVQLGLLVGLILIITAYFVYRYSRRRTRTYIDE